MSKKTHPFLSIFYLTAMRPISGNLFHANFMSFENMSGWFLRKPIFPGNLPIRVQKSDPKIQVVTSFKVQVWSIFELMNLQRILIHIISSYSFNQITRSITRLSPYKNGSKFIFSVDVLFILGDVLILNSIFRVGL